MNRRSTLLIFPFLSCLIFDCFADNNRGTNSYIFSTVDYQQGLSHSVVISVFQNNAGLMWFGTYDGVNSDEKEMDVYRSDLFTHLTNNVIFNIQQADSSYLWIMTGSGLNHFSPIRGKVIANSDIPDIYCIHSDSKGNTWQVG